MHEYPHVGLTKVQYATVTILTLKETETRARQSFKGM
jgi:hypothetical protein